MVTNKPTKPAEAAKTDEVVAPPATPAPTTPPDVLSYCPYRQATIFQQALSPNKMRVGFFLGAGCPLSIRVPDGTSTKPLIPDIAGLTDAIREKMAVSETHKESFNSILQQLDDSETNKRNIEEILTQIRGVIDIVGTGKFEEMSKDDLKKLDKALCSEIRTVMTKRLPSRDTPYHQLASWILSIPRVHPVEVFTTNYDVLMEQALEESGVPYFDGFSGSDRPFFDEASMEQHKKLPSRWARLWKMHGSINWWLTKEGEAQRREKGDSDASLMIHPSHLKYEQSRKMPFFAMQDRLRYFLATGQVVLVTCGYRFADKHLNNAILQGLDGNPAAVCFGLVYEDRAEAVSSIAKEGHRGNMRILGVDGGVLGTIDGNWHDGPKPDDFFHGPVVCNGKLEDERTNAPEKRCKFLLGDFKALGAFLADQLATRAQGEGDDNAP